MHSFKCLFCIFSISRYYGRSGTFDESRAEHFSNDKVICEQIATNNTTFFGNIGFWIMSPEAETEHDYIYKKCLTNRGHSLLNN